MSSFDEIRSGLLKKYNVNATGKTGSTNKQSGSTQGTPPQTDATDFQTIRRNLLDKYSVEKTTERQKTVASWGTRFNSTMERISNLSSKSGSQRTRKNIDGLDNDINSLIRSYETISEYADRMGIPNAQRYLKQLQEAQRQIKEFKSQFKSDDEWNWYEKYNGQNSDSLQSVLDTMDDGDEKNWLQGYTNQVYNEELPTVDVEASRKKAASLQQLLDAYRQNSRFGTDAKGEAWLQEIRDQYGGEEGLERAISRENRRANLAAQEQDRIRNADRFGNVTRNSDFAQKSAYDPSNTDIGYRYVNGDDWERYLLEKQHGQYVEEFGYHAFDSLTDEEKAVYNYYMNTGDRQSAADYLKHIQDPLSRRKGQQIFEDGFKGNAALEFVYGIDAGLDQFRSGVEGMGKMMRGDNTQSAPSATQYASSAMREDLGQSGKKLPSWLGGGTIGQAVYDSVTTTANMVPSILTSAALGLLNPTLGTVAGGAMMGAGAAGSAYQEMIDSGYTVSQARTYGALVGTAEMVMEKLLGGIGKLGGNSPVAKAIATWAGNVDNALVNLVGRIGGSAISEGMEEGIQEVFSGWLKSQITKEDFYATPADVMYSSLLGAFTGAIFEAPEAAVKVGTQVKGGHDVLKAKGVDSLTQLGRGSENADIQRLAERAANKPSAYNVGGLKAAVSDEVHSQNARDIADSLTRKGMPQKAAQQYGEMISSMLEAGSNTELQRMVMESDPTVGKTLQEIQMPTSSVYQRMTRMDEAAGKAPSIDRVAAAYGSQAEDVKNVYRLGETEPGKNLSVADFSYGFQRVFTLGREGARESALTEEIAPGLTQDQIKYAYKLGADAAAAEKAAAKKRRGDTSSVHLLNEDGSMGGEVQITAVASVDSGTVSYRLSNGTTVSEDQLSFEGDNPVLDAVRDLELDVETANVVLEASLGGKLTDKAMAVGIEEAFRFGKYGYDPAVLERTKAGRPLPESVRDSVYQAGRKQAEASRKQLEIPSKVTPSEKKGEVSFDGDRGKLSKVQRTSLEALEWIAEITGAKIYVETLAKEDGALGDKNGWYDPKDDSIHIDLNAGRDGTGTLLYTAAHEFVHRMKQNSPARFWRLADFLVAEYVKHGVNVDALVKEQQRLSQENGTELSYDEAFEEMVADAMEAMFTDSKATQKLGKLKAQDKSLWEEIKSFVQELSNKIRSVYARLKPDSAEARYVLRMKDSVDQLAELFAEGIIAEETKNAMSGTVKVKYSFAGRNSVTADRSALQQAEQLQNQGADNEEIRQKTGWFKGMDGKWRFEIDDSQMEISKEIFTYMRLGELMQHEKLYAAYPDLADIDVVFQSLDAGVNGSYHPQFDSINLSYQLKNDPIGLKDALVHEIQHAIQHREGFTSGATAASWDRKIKAGFDSRRAEDIRKAQETERELRRIQEEEPEFYRDMVELDAMTPDLPRGEVDWETLEKISDDPIEWQQYDARREELEAKYGDTKVWDMNDLLYQREKASKNMGRSGVELYFDTAGEIEARDASNRRSKTPEQRKSSPPRLGNEDTVFVESTDWNNQAIGKTANNKPFVIVERDILNGVDPSDWVKTVTQNIRSKFPNGITIGRNNIAINQKSRRELTYSGYMHKLKQSDPQVYSDKLRSTDNLDEIIQATTDWINEGAKHGRNDNIQDFARGSVLIRIGGTDYSAEVIVGTKMNGTMLLYDVLNLQKTSISEKKTDASLTSESREDSTNRQLASDTELSSPQDSQNSGRNGVPNSSIISISNSETEVNQKFSRRKQSETDSLKAQNQKLQEDVDRLRELLKLQGKVTNGTKFKHSSVEAAARYLKGKFYVGGDTKELAKLLNGFYEYIAAEKELTWESIKDQAGPAVDWLLDHEKFRRSQYAQEVLDAMKGRRFALDEKQRAEAEHMHGSYGAYQKLTRGMVSSNAETSLDSFWQEMATDYPMFFDADISSADMPRALLEILDQLENMEDMDFAMDWRMKEQSMLQEVYDSYWRVDNLQTVADRNQKKINELKGRHIQKMTELRQDHAREVQKLKDARKQNVESRGETAIRNKIRHVVKELEKVLLRGNKKRNVKQGMRGVVEDAIASASILFTKEVSDEELLLNGIQTDLIEPEVALLNRASDLLDQISIEKSRLPAADRLAEANYDEIMAHADADTAAAAAETTASLFAQTNRRKLNALEKEYREVMKDLRPVFARERNRRNGTAVSDVLNKLATSYRELKSSEYSYLQEAYSEEVYEYLNGLQDKVKGAIIRDMNREQLQTVYNAYKMVLTTIRNANKAFVDGRSIEAEAQQLVQEFRSRKKPGNVVGVVAKNLANAAGWKYEKLYYALKRINSPTLTKLFGMLAESENVTMRDIQEAKAFQMEQVEKYGYNDWDIVKKIDHTFVDNTGQEFRLTLGEMMALYAYSRREGADKNIEIGGFTFGKTALTDAEPATTYKLTADQCAKITGILTGEQKSFAEAMQKYLSKDMGAKGNEVSMKLYGIEMFGEENYFPLHIAGEYKAVAQESQAKAQAGFQAMTNAGFTHARNIDSTAPIVLENFMDVWADHVNEMSRYHGAVPALEDIRRVMNYSVYSEAMESSVSVKAAMTNAYGKQAVNYFDDLYREANSGAITDKMDDLPRKMLSAFRKNSVAYSASVVIQQPASIYRARALVDRKYFGKHGFFTLTGGVLRILNRKKWDAAYAEMMKYAPGVTMAKEIGGFDTSTGGSIRSYLLDTEKSFAQSMKHDTLTGKAGSVLGLVDDNPIANLPNVADKIAWIEMWEAVKRETVDKNRSLSTDTEAFWQKVGERFTEVVRATQVYDSMFSKSPMLKSRNLAAQYLVSFMNEPNTVANMAENAIRDLSRGEYRTAGKAAAALVTSIVTTNLLKSLVYAMRDDDEDETAKEKYISAVVGSLISDVNPLNYIPYARDVWSVVQGYDVERPDISIVGDAVNAIRKMRELSKDFREDMTPDQLEAWDKKMNDARWRVAETLSPLFGIPLKNIRRDVLAVINTAGMLDSTESNTRRGTAYAREEGVYGTKKTDKQQLYEARIAGDQEHAARVEARYDDEKSANAAVKSAIREAFMDRDIDLATANQYLILHAGVSAAEAHWTVDKWEYTKEHGSDDGYGKYNTFFDAVESGKNLSGVVKEYADYGVTKSTLSGQITERFSQQYMEMNQKERQAFRKKLEAAYTACGYDQEKATQKLDEWDFKAEVGDRDDVTSARVKNYNLYCKTTKLPKDIYLAIMEFSDNTKNDIDEDGNNIKYSAVEKVMAEMQKYGLTREQKEALAQCFNWGSGTIKHITSKGLW